MELGDPTTTERVRRSDLDVDLDAAEAAISALLEKIEAAALAQLTAGEKISFWQRLEAFRNRLPLIDHHLIADAQDTDLASERCCSSLAMLLARTLRMSPGEAAARIRAASAVGPRTSPDGEVLGPVLPSLAAAQRAGQLSGEQIQIVARAIQKPERPNWILMSSRRPRGS